MQTNMFPRKDTNKSVPTKVFVTPYGETTFLKELWDRSKSWESNGWKNWRIEKIWRMGYQMTPNHLEILSMHDLLPHPATAGGIR